MQRRSVPLHRPAALLLLLLLGACAGKCLHDQEARLSFCADRVDYAFWLSDASLDTAATRDLLAREMWENELDGLVLDATPAEDDSGMPAPEGMLRAVSTLPGEDEVVQLLALHTLEDGDLALLQEAASFDVVRGFKDTVDRMAADAQKKKAVRDEAKKEGDAARKKKKPSTPPPAEKTEDSEADVLTQAADSYIESMGGNAFKAEVSKAKASRKRCRNLANENEETVGQLGDEDDVSTHAMKLTLRGAKMGSEACTLAADAADKVAEAAEEYMAFTYREKRQMSYMARQVSDENLMVCSQTKALVRQKSVHAPPKAKMSDARSLIRRCGQHARKLNSLARRMSKHKLGRTMHAMVWGTKYSVDAMCKLQDAAMKYTEAAAHQRRRKLNRAERRHIHYWKRVCSWATLSAERWAKKVGYRQVQNVQQETAIAQRKAAEAARLLKCDPDWAAVARQASDAAMDAKHAARTAAGVLHTGKADPFMKGPEEESVDAARRANDAERKLKKERERRAAERRSCLARSGVHVPVPKAQQHADLAETQSGGSGSAPHGVDGGGGEGGDGLKFGAMGAREMVHAGHHVDHDRCSAAFKAFVCASQFPRCSSPTGLAHEHAEPLGVCRATCERYAHECGVEMDCSRYEDTADCTSGAERQ